jgi:hypothetical protein
MASERPIPMLSAAELAARLPEKAREDLLEWTPGFGAELLFAGILVSEFDPRDRLSADPSVIVTDDRPFNEYFLLRRTRAQRRGTYAEVQ